MRVSLPVLMVLAFATSGAAADLPLPEKIEYNRDVRPILSDNCFHCHGPDKNKREADLRLDDGSGFTGSGSHAAVITPKSLDRSELWKRLVSTVADEKMPPESSGKKLTARDMAIIRRWIEQGAEYQGHWAFQPVKRPPVPDVPAGPTVRNPIDRFMAGRLQTAGLQANADADRVTLIRRLSFDLTGLPPKPEDVDAFVADTRPDAVEKLVDRLLQSPHYGERMAVYWLDLVRFADSAGYHSDNPRDIAPYRDYVINAFQQNLPFHQFTVEQLAGDLLPNPTMWQKVASGYNRLLQTTEEGGAQAKEYIAKYSGDRVRNVASVWLGGTMMCSECHDHKYDPYSTRDFYSLAAFFADVQEAAIGRREPGMPVPSPADDARLKEFDTQIAVAQQNLQTAVDALLQSGNDWENELHAQTEWLPLPPPLTKVQGESHLHLQDDGSFLVDGKVAAKETFVLTFDTPQRQLTGLRLEALVDERLPAKGPGTAPNGNFVLTEFKLAVIDKDGKEQPVKWKRAVADHAQSGHAIETAIDNKNDTGWAVLPQIGVNHEAIFETESPFSIDDATAKFVVRLEFNSQFPQHNIGRLRLTATKAANPAGSWITPALRTILAVAPAERTAEQKVALTNYLRDQSVRFAELRGVAQKLHEQKQQFANNLPRSLITTAGTPRVVRVLPRGNWLDDSGDVTEPAIPAFLGKLDVKDRRANRLDLANWVISSENPLTARVMVNRLWKQFFGIGLSKTVDDLGSQGEWPTHPELLDWLAIEFRESGWNVQHIIKLMVLSHTYQQSSVQTKEARAVDPFNRLLSAQNRFRLDAEFVRDNMLSIAGLLSPRVGGESDYPYQPDGYWDYLNFPRRTWPTDKAERLYRRGLYTHWQRSFLHPPMLIFDAPSREECVADRPRSNTPQQALALLNEPASVEAARVFAAKIVKDGGPTDAAKLTWAYRRAVSRSPSAMEQTILLGLLEKHRTAYKADRAAAEALLKSAGESPMPTDSDVAEVAAWTSLTRTLLNLHETITRL